MSAVSVRKLSARAKLSQEELARLVGTSWATVSRWERRVARPGPEARARLERLTELVERIGDALAPGELPRFLLNPQPLLRNYRPVDLLESRYSFEDLVAFIESAKSGDMA